MVNADFNWVVFQKENYIKIEVCILYINFVRDLEKNFEVEHLLLLFNREVDKALDADEDFRKEDSIENFKKVKIQTV